MYVDLDESALTNNIDSKNGVPNHGCVTENVRNYEGNCASNLFALRTIHAGEELVMDYGAYLEFPPCVECLPRLQ